MAFYIVSNRTMYLPYDDTQNYPIYNVKLVVETFKYSTLLTNQSKFTQVPKVINPTNKQALL